MKMKIGEKMFFMFLFLTLVLNGMENPELELSISK